MLFLAFLHVHTFFTGGKYSIFSPLIWKNLLLCGVCPWLSLVYLLSELVFSAPHCPEIAFSAHTQKCSVVSLAVKNKDIFLQINSIDHISENIRRVAENIPIHCHDRVLVLRVVPEKKELQHCQQIKSMQQKEGRAHP